MNRLNLMTMVHKNMQNYGEMKFFNSTEIDLKYHFDSEKYNRKIELDRKLNMSERVNHIMTQVRHQLNMNSQKPSPPKTALKPEKPALKTEKPALKRKKPALKAEKPALKAENQTLKNENQASKIENPDSKTEKSDLKTENPCLKTEKPALKTTKSAEKDQKNKKNVILNKEQNKCNLDSKEVNVPRTKSIWQKRFKVQKPLHPTTVSSSQTNGINSQKRVEDMLQHNAMLENMLQEHKQLRQDRQSIANEITEMRGNLNDLRGRLSSSIKKLDDKKTYCELHGLSSCKSCKK